MAKALKRYLSQDVLDVDGGLRLLKLQDIVSVNDLLR